MIIKNKTQIKILEFLTENWYDSFIAKEIKQKTSISFQSIYDSLHYLTGKNIVKIHNNSYSINFKNEIAWAFKKLHDSNKFSQLDQNLQNVIALMREKLELFYTYNLLAFLVFGSTAKLEHKKESDIDFFVLSKSKRDFLKTLTSDYKNFNYINKSIVEFSKEFEEGDDLLISIFKNNMIMYGNDFLRPYFEIGLPSIGKNVIDDREKALEKMRHKIDVLYREDNKQMLVDIFKRYILLKARIELIRKENKIPSTKQETLNRMEKIDKKLIEAYNTVNIKNIKKMVDIYV